MSNLNCFKLTFISARQIVGSFLTALLMLLFTQAAHADTETTAMTAAAADTASTAAALASGLVELNPLGLVGSVVVKVATITLSIKPRR